MEEKRSTVAEVPPDTDWSIIPLTDAGDDAIVVRGARRLLQEPALLFTTAYLLVSMLGLWCSYWFYRGFNLPILDYLQASDFLVAGIRDPAYVGLLLAGVGLVLLVTWPETLRLRNPAKVAALRGRSWGWRLLLSRSALTRWDATGLRPMTAMTLAITLFMAVAAAGYVHRRGADIRRHATGDALTVQLNGDAAPLAGSARLLGSSSAFVFLWWPAQRRAEAIPIASVRRLQVAPVRAAAAQGKAPATPAPRAVPAR